MVAHTEKRLLTRPLLHRAYTHHHHRHHRCSANSLGQQRIYAWPFAKKKEKKTTSLSLLPLRPRDASCFFPSTFRIACLSLIQRLLVDHNNTRSNSQTVYFLRLLFRFSDISREFLIFFWLHLVFSFNISRGWGGGDKFAFVREGEACINDS